MFGFNIGDDDEESLFEKKKREMLEAQARGDKVRGITKEQREAINKAVQDKENERAKEKAQEDSRREEDRIAREKKIDEDEKAKEARLEQHRIQNEARTKALHTLSDEDYAKWVIDNEKVTGEVNEVHDEKVKVIDKELKQATKDREEKMTLEDYSPREIVFNDDVDQYLEHLPVGSVAKAIGNNLYGINHKQTGNAVPTSKDMQGFTFFTRPQLNLTKMNLTNYRGFYSMLTDNDASYQKYTRLMLDPRLSGSAEQGVYSPFVDPLNAFIPLLSNNVTSVSGWPDISAPTYTTESGLYGQESGFVDGVTNHFESFDLDVSFKNFKGNPLLYFFHVWVKYATLVFEGVLNPYLDMITENEIDYNTRIYRLVLDQSKKYVTYIGSTGASFPLNVPTGSIFDFSNDTPYNNKNSEISIRFRSFGFIAFEDILKLKFNQTMAIFNPNMRAILKSDFNNPNQIEVAREDESVIHRVKGSSYVKIPHSIAMAGDEYSVNGSSVTTNFRSYPYINLLTNELEWFCDSNRFNQK